jgi:predicted dehydrogenase
VKRYRFAVIGCRHFHIVEFINEMIHLGHEFIGIYEMENINNRDIITEKYKVDSYDNLDDLLSKEIDIVGCADINSRKIDVIELCENHQIHIMTDKPIVTSIKQYDRLERIIRRNQIQVGMMLTERFQPVFQTLKRMVDERKFGEITHISMRKPHRLSKAKREPWFFSKTLSGGIIVDLLIHDFDLIRWLTGMEVTEINGYIAKNMLPEYEDFYDTASVGVLLNNSLPVQLYSDWHTPSNSWTWGDGRVFITGTEGCAELRLQGDPLIEKQSLLLYGSHQELLQKIPLQQPHSTLANDFINRIEGKSAFITHQAILEATMDTLEADRKVRKIFDAHIREIGRNVRHVFDRREINKTGE